MSVVYDVCVVGAGMIGSAAARHAASFPNTKVCLIGPHEPKNKQTTNSQFFGAHYDEGRLARHASSIPEWALVNVKSIPNYRSLEQITGIDFYSEVGCLMIDSKHESYIEENLASIKDLNVKGVQMLTQAQAQKLYPYMCISQDDGVVYESRGSGVINPRRFVLALQTAAHLADRDIVREVVDEVTNTTTPDGASVMQVKTGTGRTYLAKKVLLATGAFTEFSSLLPKGVRPKWNLVTHTVILAEVSKEDQVTMRSMPPMVYNGKACKLAMDGKPYDGWGIYSLPPIKYPNGKYYLKIGHHFMPRFNKDLYTHRDVVEWYQGKGSPEAIHWLKKVMAILFPDFKPVSIESDSCVAAMCLDTMLPYIDLLTPTLGVAIGGNGGAAKSCDTLGKMAADLLITGTWQSDHVPRDAFRFRHRTSQSNL